MDATDSKLRSLAAMVKRGTEHERATAEVLLRKLCKKYDLDYDLVLTDLLLEEFIFNYKEEGMTKQLALQTIARYALLEGTINYFTTKDAIKVKTTVEKWNDFLAAVPEVKRKYKEQRREVLIRHRRERDAFLLAFVQRHKLHYPYPLEPGNQKRLTAAQIRKMRRAYELMQTLEGDLQIYKQVRG